MSASIQQVTINSIVESRLVLTRATAARMMSIGNNWTQLRIGLRFAFGSSGSDILGTPRLYVGCLSSPAGDLSNGPLEDTTSNFLGVASDTWAWTFSSSNYLLSKPFAAAVKVGSSLTVAGPTSGVMRLSAAQATVRRALIILVDKGTDGNADWKVGLVYHTGVDNPDITYSMLLNSMEAAPNESNLLTRLEEVRDVLNLEAGFAGLYAAAVLSSTLTVDEAANGPLNSLCVAWGRSVVPLYLSEILFAKTA